MREYLEALTREQLIDVLEMSAKDVIAMDGVWFQAVEAAEGMDAAMEYDKVVWKNYARTEGLRLKRVLGLGEHPGLDGLEQCLRIRYSTLANATIDIQRDEDSLTYRIVDCRIQRARERKGMEFHPCKLAGVFEFSELAKSVDSRIVSECISCYPDITDKDACCVWRFTIAQE